LTSQRSSNDTGFLIIFPHFNESHSVEFILKYHDRDFHDSWSRDLGALGEWCDWRSRILALVPQFPFHISNLSKTHWFHSPDQGEISGKS
jgi:hypothetical protein